MLLLPSLILTLFHIDLSNENVELIEQVDNVFLIILFEVVMIPLFETFIFQFLLINMVKALAGRSRYTFWLSVLIPSVLFGLSHSYSLLYIVAATLTGIIFSLTYYISTFLRKENGFLIVFLLHGLNNLLAILIN
ncbi:MAG TPA: CPBP family intramembrane glutamic endopeptidase [Bacteroidales bacterium]|nr:CPBP family intramembrane glutamic endopeptidase [Bacteroidales bacterium]